MASGALSMSVVLPGASTYNLTALGASDWIDYPGTSPVRKSGGGNQISVTHVGTFTDNVATDSKITTTWNNGTPTASASSTSLVFSSSGVGIGYSLTFPADTNQRTVTVIGGNYNANVRITATLSDGGAPQVVDNSLTGSAATGKQAVATIVYRAASAAQTLTVTILSTSQGSSSNTSFQAAAMSAPTSVLSADSGSFSLTGSDAGLAAQRKLNAQPGSFALAGATANLKAVRVLAAGSGAFALTGQAAALTFQPKPSATGPTYTLTASTGSFVLTGRPTPLLFRRRISAASGTFVATGRVVALRFNRRMFADTGSFSLQGSPATLTIRSTADLIDASLIPESRRAVFSVSSRKAVFQVTSRIARF